MTARIIDGAAIARAVRAEVAEDVAAFVAAGHRPPHLSVILAGDDPASHVYVRHKGRACEEAGMTTDTVVLPATVTQQELLGHIERLNDDPGVDGILVQMPLPQQVDAQAAMAALNQRKDVDGLSPVNLGLLLQGVPLHPPATPAGVIEMLRREGIATDGARVVIVGRSVLVGRPLAMLLANKREGANATVTIAHTGTRDLPTVTREADILVAAMGRAATISAEMVRPGATVIDVGINQVEDASKRSGYRLVGDVDYEAARQVAGAITPVPGGVGPMTIAMLLRNTLRAARLGVE